MPSLGLKRQDLQRHNRKTVTFTGAAGLGAAGTVALFTVTGKVLVNAIIPHCSTLLTATGAATVALGVTNATTLFIAATTATDIDADEFWVDTAPDISGVAIPAALKDIAVSQNIFLTIAAADVSTGTMTFDIYWQPISDGASVAVA